MLSITLVGVRFVGRAGQLRSQAEPWNEVSEANLSHQIKRQNRKTETIKFSGARPRRPLLLRPRRAKPTEAPALRPRKHPISKKPHFCSNALDVPKRCARQSRRRSRESEKFKVPSAKVTTFIYHRYCDLICRRSLGTRKIEYSFSISPLFLTFH